MDDYGMYKDPVKLNAFMNHVPLTFAVAACTRINHHLQNVTDQPDNDDLKHTCMLEAEHLYQSITTAHPDSANLIEMQIDMIQNF